MPAEMRTKDIFVTLIPELLIRLLDNPVYVGLFLAVVLVRSFLPGR